jgi:glutamate-1-semialdehyde 2,1-aminomutase
MALRRPHSEQERDLIRRAAEVLPGGTLGNVYAPRERAFIISRAQGARIWDVTGNEYIDFLLGSGPMLLGHAHSAVIDAVQGHLSRGSTYFATNEPVVRLAEAIVDAVPCAEKVRFTTSGSEAIFFALRVARAYRGRDKILKFEGGYHGHSDYTQMSTTPKSPLPFPQPTANSAGIPASILQEVLVAPFNDIETTSDIIAQHHDELAAVILEPFQRVIAPAPGFLEGLRQVTREYDIPMIYDEVVTGFRFSYGGAQDYYGVVPDMACLGKVIGGGFPLAAVVGRDEIMRHFDPELEGQPGFVPQVGTLSGNPIAAVAGLATLEQLRQPGAYSRLFETGAHVRAGLERLLREAEIPAQVLGEDPVFDIYFTPPGLEPITDYRGTLQADGALYRRFSAALLDNGLLKGPTKFYLSLAHDDAEVDRSLEIMAAALEAISAPET